MRCAALALQVLLLRHLVLGASPAFAGLRARPAARSSIAVRVVSPATGGNIALERFVAPARRWPGASIIACTRALGFVVLLYGLGIIFAPLIALTLPVVKRRDPNQRCLTDRLIAMWSKTLLWPFQRVTVRGIENLPAAGQGCVLVSNHQSFMDILSLYHLNHPFKFVSKKSILKIPVVGFAMKATNTITLEREDSGSQMKVFRNCVGVLKKGVKIFIFPEGTRSKDGRLLDFKKGPFSMARRAKVPILPITINGTGRIMPSKKEYLIYFSRAGVEIVIHPMIPAEEVIAADDKDLQAGVRSTIESAMPPSLRAHAEEPQQV